MPTVLVSWGWRYDRRRFHAPTAVALACRSRFSHCGTTSLATFRADAIAGVTVGLVALPLAMAFAIASGLTPQAGIYCAVVTGFLISALGGSRVQIGGPTGAFVVVVAGIVAKYGVSGLYHLHDDGGRHPGGAWRDAAAEAPCDSFRVQWSWGSRTGSRC